MKVGVKMDRRDNVAVVMEDIYEGEILKIDNSSIKARQNINRGHKIAIADLKDGEYIIKYGVPIGKAKSKIAAGEHVHVHNVIDITGEINSVDFNVQHYL